MITSNSGQMRGLVITYVG